MEKKVPIIRISNFLREYGMGTQDVLAVKDFSICENPETINALRAELIAISNNKVSPVTLDRIVGKARLKRFGSYKTWAKTMILWLKEFKE